MKITTAIKIYDSLFNISLGILILIPFSFFKIFENSFNAVLSTFALILVLILLNKIIFNFLIKNSKYSLILKICLNKIFKLPKIDINNYFELKKYKEFELKEYVSNNAINTRINEETSNYHVIDFINDKISYKTKIITWDEISYWEYRREKYDEYFKIFLKNNQSKIEFQNNTSNAKKFEILQLMIIFDLKYGNKNSLID